MDNYDGFTDKEVSSKDLADLANLAAQLADAEKAVADLQAQLENAQRRVTDLTERQIPELMDSLGLKRFTTSSGFEIDIKRTVRASIPVAFRQAAYDWLEQNGHGALIKRQISVAFDREQLDAAKQLESELSGEFENIKVDSKVESSTLRAWISEQLEAGNAIPLELFGAWEQRTARISRPK
jgi:hypothetical protein